MTKIYYSILSMGLMLTVLSGCSLLEKQKKYIFNGAQASVTPVSNSTSISPAKEKTEKVLTPPNQKNKIPTNVKELSIGSIVEKSSLGEEKVENTKQKTDTVMSVEVVPTTINTASVVEGEWTIHSVRNKIVTGEERPYITFDTETGRLYGSNGCNIINGNFELEGENSLTIHQIVTTMKMCQDAPYEYMINLALADVKSINSYQQGPITFLELKNDKGQTIMELKRHNMDFLNGAWKVMELNEIPMQKSEFEDDEASITINIPDLKIHGTTGCNIFNGSLFIDPDKINSMQFINLLTTRMGCPPDSRETEFLLALEQVESAKLVAKNMAIMYSVENKPLFKLQRIVSQEQE